MKRSTRLREDAGFSLVDVTISITILTVGILALAATYVHATRLSMDTRDTRILTASFQNIVSTLENADFSTLPQNFGSGTAKPQFWCRPNGDAVFTDPGDAWITGTVAFFNDESTVPAAFANLTGGFDLNADGNVTSGAITDYRILPTRVTFTSAANRTLTFDFILTAVQSW